MPRPKFSRDFLRDPTRMDRRLQEFEDALVKLIGDFKRAVIALLKDPNKRAHGTTQVIIADPESFFKELNRLWAIHALNPGDKVIDLQIHRAYIQGSRFAGIMLGAPKDVRQTEWEKIGALLTENTKGSFKGIGDETTKQIRSAIANGILLEAEAGDIEQEILHICDSVGINRAKTMVRTETMKAVNRGIHDRYVGAGLTDEDEEWLTAIDDRTCDECLANDGKTIKEIGERPPLHPNCRCTIIPKIRVPRGDIEEEE